MAPKDPNAGAKLLSADVRRVFGSIDLNPANAGYRDLRKKVKAARAAKSATQTGPTSRGGARRAKTAPAVTAVKPVSSKARAKSAATPAAKAKATPTMKPGSMKRSAIPKAEVTVRDVAPNAKALAPASSGISSKKRDVSLGGLVGRTGGKWHLGKKVGKG